jgi:hypothetical protein
MHFIQSNYKYLAIALIIFVLFVAIFKFSLATDPQNYCSFGPFAKHCHENVSYDDLYQTLRGISRALPLSATGFLLLFTIILSFGAPKESQNFLVSKSASIEHYSLTNVTSAQKTFLHWIKLHEGGSPAAFL